MALHPAQGAMDGRLLGAPHPDYEGVPTESVGAGVAGRRRAQNHPVRSRGLSQRPSTDPCGRATRGTRAPQSVQATNEADIYRPSRSRRPRNELAYTRRGAQAVGESVAVPAAADRQMVATLEKRLPLHVAPAQEMDERYRGSEAERPRPDPGRQRPAGAMPPRGGGETFPRRRRRGLRSAAPDLHGEDDQARRQTGGAGTSAR
ncbi:hypothetical protein T08_1550 [Trichinella sp. T8]|nr:hypothetical protein T08_1550 [Trichinella sp. T8]